MQVFCPGSSSYIVWAQIFRVCVEQHIPRTTWKPISLLFCLFCKTVYSYTANAASLLLIWAYMFELNSGHHRCRGFSYTCSHITHCRSVQFTFVEAFAHYLAKMGNSSSAVSARRQTTVLVQSGHVATWRHKRNHLSSSPGPVRAARWLTWQKHSSRLLRLAHDLHRHLSGCLIFGGCEKGHRFLLSVCVWACVRVHHVMSIQVCLGTTHTVLHHTHTYLLLVCGSNHKDEFMSFSDVWWYACTHVRAHVQCQN